ncbi:MAG: hypothetical protein IJT87_04885 [Ruminiclostridium sp.]|nr:hypothetical protein [Ruminiclostridium sp.]
MTVEELNVKISADAENFKTEVAAANVELQTFKNRAVAAAAEITKAFDGLVTVTAAATPENDNNGGSVLPQIPDTIPVGPFLQDPGELTGSGSPQTAVTPDAAFDFRTGLPQRTADVLALESSDTLIGAFGGTDNGAQTVNLTTSVTLDGDKVGESVDRFLIRRNRITNGLGGMS